MSLNAELQATREAFVASTPVQVHSVLFQIIEDLQKSGLASGLEVGSTARDFLLTDALGTQVRLSDEWKKGPVILQFYRGSWCPYCNMQLLAYQKILPDIHRLGAQLIAISPQSPDNTLSQQEKLELRFHVLSDTRGIVASKFNLLYDVPDYLIEMYKQFPLDLAEYNASDRWILPVPATIMIDEQGIVRYSYVNPDFTVRLEPSELLYQLESL
ncbi:peroxiredoxin-like family protein [Tumebacillus permanentifrigoris]|uniref:thioredoxin-dependent peroxiredoxin n=1 Tax=Tumebacillus permanentifrigoris TaxID=378543 RepID=A0A316DBB0_9BACL|nr:peroxiredoxin-like family protein [Tumebacillus permanentifrigoris]PWK14885.1 peroxiredoxin [Tumebacillus permanentifrigoris]